MKKRFLSVILSGAMILGAAVPALAGSPVATPTSEADVTFQEDPAGALKIDSGAPAFTFGTRIIELGDKFYPETSGSDIDIVVHDLRGTGAGWRLSAQLGEFSGVTTPADKLGGAIVTMMSGAITQAPALTSGTAPTSGRVDLTAGASSSSPVLTAISGAGLNESKITYTATASAATTSWATDAAASAVGGVYLKVVSGTPRAQQYKATMDWTLINAPA